MIYLRRAPDERDSVPESDLAEQLAAKDARIAEQDAVIAAQAARTVEQDTWTRELVFHPHVHAT